MNPPPIALMAAGVHGRLQPLTLTLGPGVVALVGANGAGKSTLLALMAGRLPASTGAVTLYRHPARSLAAAPTRADVPQAVDFPPRAHVSEILGVARAARGVSSEGVNAAIERMGIGNLLHRPAGRLSGGERQRVALVAALMGAPHVWILDEPAAHLDRETLARLGAWVVDHARAGGTVVVGAHRDEEVEAYQPQRVIRLEAGAVVADETRAGPPPPTAGVHSRP
jgi:ABC-type multidrug transport system ATPase subunit